MRRLVTDTKLLHILDEIEKYIGTVALAPMPEEHRALARCTIHPSHETGWVLWHIPEENTTQATLCHELAHLMLLLEGWPMFIVESGLTTTDYLSQTVHMLANLVSHIYVWKIVKCLGFNEIPDYKPGLEDLIAQVQESRLLIDAYPAEILPFRAAYLVHGLLCPAESEIRTQLRNAASRTMPKALELADAIIQVFEKQVPLFPQSCAEALSEICGLLKIHRGILIASWPDKIVPNFRSRILV